MAEAASRAWPVPRVASLHAGSTGILPGPPTISPIRSRPASAPTSCGKWPAAMAGALYHA